MRKTAAQLLKDIETALAAIPEEPFAVFMREQGCPVNEGWRLLIPRVSEMPLPDVWYVKESSYVDGPVFMKCEPVPYSWVPVGPEKPSRLGALRVFLTGKWPR